MILVGMDTGDPKLYYGSKRRHFIGVDIKITGDGPPSDTLLLKVARVDEGLKTIMKRADKKQNKTKNEYLTKTTT